MRELTGYMILPIYNLTQIFWTLSAHSGRFIFLFFYITICEGIFGRAYPMFLRMPKFPEFSA